LDAVDPVDFVASAAAHRLWHAGEGICASADQDVPHQVSTPEALTLAFAHLEGTGPETTYGFDVEWADPEGAAGGGASASLLLQVAARHTAVLVDVPALSSTPAGAEALRRTVGAFFDRARTEVVGFGSKQDLGRLRSSPRAGGATGLAGWTW